MGSCNCMGSKKEDGSITLDNSIPTNNQKLQSESLPSSAPSGTAPTNVKLESISPIEVQLPKPVQIPPKRNNIRIQSVCRGYFARKIYAKNLKAKASQPEPAKIWTFQGVSEEAKGFLSPLVKEILVTLPAFQFSTEQSPENIKRLQAPIKIPDGGIYEGECNGENQQHGRGTLYSNDGSFYQGHWKAGKLHGKGRKISPTGDYYEGDWVEGQMQGKGKMVYNMKNVYEGDWVLSKQHGFGVETWIDGSRYEGNYKDGLKNGFGKFSWVDGSHYEGEFVNNEIEGKGKYVWTNDREYEGEWKNNKMHGRGIFKWSDGRYYDGQYTMDQKEGWGIFGWPNGKKYEGNWLNGKQHGQGTLYNNKGKGRKGVWENGKMKKDPSDKSEDQND